MKAVKGLLQSRKATMVLAVFVGLAVLVALGRLDAGVLQRYLDVVLPAWLGAHAVEEGAKAVSRRSSRTGVSPDERSG